MTEKQGPDPEMVARALARFQDELTRSAKKIGAILGDEACVSSDVQCPGCGRSFKGKRGLSAHQNARFQALDCKPR